MLNFIGSEWFGLIEYILFVVVAFTALKQGRYNTAGEGWGLITLGNVASSASIYTTASLLGIS